MQQLEEQELSFDKAHLSVHGPNRLHGDPSLRDPGAGPGSHLQNWHETVAPSACYRAGHLCCVR